MRMHEQWRQAYLQTFEIDSYEPRWVLPNALPSVQCEYEWVDDEVVEAELSNAQVSAPSQSVMDSVALDDRAEPPPRERTHNIDVAASSQKKPVHNNSALKPQPQSQLRFVLSVWRIAPNLLVVDSRRPRLALPTDALLLNILKALGYPLERLPAVEHVRWPLTQSSGSAEEQVTEARAYVQAYLQAQLGHFPFSKVLLMGASAVRFTLDEQLWPDDDDPRVLLGKHFSLSSFDSNKAAVPEAIVVPSLSAMLQTPVLKSVTWQAIQPLRANPLQPL
ncbi:hypothetical protein NBRC116494_08490 [Aurantivibrio plasticivorans]